MKIWKDLALCHWKSVALALVLLLTSCALCFAGSDNTSFAIKWLPLTQSSPLANRSKLVAEIMQFLEPLRRKVFGNPPVITTKAYFVKISGGWDSLGALSTPTSTNVDGTLACVLSPASLQALQVIINKAHQCETFASSSITVFDGMQAALTTGRLIEGSMTKTDLGGGIDVVHRVVGTNVLMRAIAEMSENVANGVSKQSKVVSAASNANASTVFQAALDAQVPTGGGLAVWAQHYDSTNNNTNCYLMLICPAIQGGAPGAPVGPGPQGPPSR